MKYLVLLAAFLSTISLSWSVEWEQIKTDITGNIRTVYREGDTILLGDVGMVKSIDGGKTFKPVNNVTYLGSEVNLADQDMRVMQITKASSGLMMARLDFQLIIFSMDNGESWYSSFLVNDLMEHKLLYIDSVHYLIRDELFEKKNALYFSTNNGETWQNDYFSELDSSKMKCFVKSPTEEKLLFLYSENGSQEFIVKYDLKAKTFDKIPVDLRTQDFDVIGDSWIIYLDDTTMMYESKDEGKNWEVIGNMRDTLIKYPEYNKMLNMKKGDIEAGTNGKFIKYQFEYTTNDTKKHIGLMYSDDKGKSWNPVDFEGRDLNKLSIKLVDNTIFLLPSRAAELNKETNKFESLAYPYSTLYQYKETDDMKMLVTNSEYEPLWINDGEWKNIGRVDQAWITNDNSYYARIGATLNYVDDNQSLQLLGDVYYINAWLLNNGILNAKYQNTSDINKNLLFKKEHKLFEIGEAYSAVSTIDDNNLLALKEVSAQTYDLTKIDMKNNTEENLSKTITASLPSSLQLSSNDTSILIYSSDDKVISYDNGLTWTDFVLPENTSGYNVKVLNRNIYFHSGGMLLTSKDAVNWENMMEGIHSATIYSFEFDQKNRIVVYTSNGTFRTKEPVSVEENTNFISDINIKIFPNPTSDIINIESDENISNIELYNLSGELLSKVNGLTIDATNLPTGAYFIKMEVGEKSIYRQFIVER